MEQPLTVDIRSSIRMSCATIFSPANRQAYQCGVYAFEKVFIYHPSDHSSSEAISNLPAAGLPVYSTSPEDPSAGSYPGRQDGFHRQAAPEPGPAPEAIGALDGPILKCDRDPGVGVLSAAKRAWSKRSPGTFRRFIALIGWQLGSFGKCIAFWFRSGPSF
jgi:hypothetical protein